MWNSRKLFKIKIQSGKTNIVIPIPIFVLWELLECIEDLLTVLILIIPNINIKIKDKSYKTKEALKLCRYIIQTLDEVRYCEPFDLVDIQSDDDIVKISIK